MICVLKHIKTGRYIKAAQGFTKFNRIGVFNTYHKVQLFLTDKISQAKLIEDPDWASVAGYGCEIVPVKIENKLEILPEGEIYNGK